MECNGKFSGDSHMEFLRHILSRCSCPIFLTEDGEPYHRRKDVREFREKMKTEERLFAYRLPSYSPDKNPIEKLWKNTKREATHLKYFATFEDLRSSVIRTFKKYLEDAAKIICVMKKIKNSGRDCLTKTDEIIFLKNYSRTAVKTYFTFYIHAGKFVVQLFKIFFNLRFSHFMRLFQLLSHIRFLIF
ncbi:MAG: hypothetical protein B6245_15050 [Desulfobacteraceae bacterium 4572_88]|nr:MAG: hypothetical protein B6245_15050 [Desulfobacteraceae bacterium 4572_88]